MKLERKDLIESGEYLALCSDGKYRAAHFVNDYLPGGVVYCVRPADVEIICYYKK